MVAIGAIQFLPWLQNSKLPKFNFQRSCFAVKICLIHSISLFKTVSSEKLYFQKLRKLPKIMEVLEAINQLRFNYFLCFSQKFKLRFCSLLVRVFCSNKTECRENEFLLMLISAIFLRRQWSVMQRIESVWNWVEIHSLTLIFLVSVALWFLDKILLHKFQVKVG